MKQFLILPDNLSAFLIRCSRIEPRTRPEQAAFATGIYGDWVVVPCSLPLDFKPEKAFLNGILQIKNADSAIDGRWGVIAGDVIGLEGNGVMAVFGVENNKDFHISEGPIE